MQKSNFRIVNRLEIDDNKWDFCIQNSTNLVYPYSWYLDIVAPNWKAIIYKDYEAVFPLTWRKKLGINYLFQPFFTQQLGLFCLDSSAYFEIYPLVLDLIKSEFKHINIHLNHHFVKGLEQRNNFELPLKHTIERHQKFYSSQTIRNLKKAQKCNLSIKENTEPYSIIELFRKTKGNEVTELKKEDYNTLNLLCENVAKNRILESISILNDNEIIAGSLFFINQNRITMLLLTSNENGKKSGASTLLINYIISKYCNSKFVLDFEGSQIESLARFYHGFGSLNRVYSSFQYTIIPFKK